MFCRILWWWNRNITRKYISFFLPVRKLKLTFAHLFEIGYLFNLKQIINILQPKVRNRTKYTCGTEALRNALNFCKTRFVFHESVTVFLKIILLNIVICSEVANLSFVVWTMLKVYRNMRCVLIRIVWVVSKIEWEVSAIWWEVAGFWQEV